MDNYEKSLHRKLKRGSLIGIGIVLLILLIFTVLVAVL
jgi:hypothetical protein